VSSRHRPDRRDGGRRRAVSGPAVHQGGTDRQRRGAPGVL